MKKIISVFLVYIFLIFPIKVFANETTFADIKNHWAKKEIELLVNESIIQGYEDGTFRPNNHITASEFLKMLVEMADYKLETVGNRWPDWYIETAIKNNLVLVNDFQDYNKKITRNEVVNIISKYIGIEDVTKNKNIFTDLKNEEKEKILKLVKLNVISGYDDNTFRGENKITRAEACKIIINSYNAKQNLLKTRKVEINDTVTNIKLKNNVNSNNINEMENTYEIKNNRIYIYDEGRYANFKGQTLNQEYINDKKIIKLITTLIDEESYTELKFVPDKYIINNLNICYGNKKTEVQNGSYIFEIRFYENAYYNVSNSKGISDFSKEACIKIKTGKMWKKQFESNTEIECSDKNLFKLEEAIGIILDDSVKDEFIEYFIEKRIQASKISNSDEPKILEVKKIGKYTINTFCIHNNELEFYIQKF